MFHVVLSRSGPQWDATRTMEEQWRWDEHAAFMDRLVEIGFLVLGGPLEDQRRVVHAIEASSEDVVRETLAGDPWHGTILRVESIDPWTIRLDARSLETSLDSKDP